MSGEERFSGWAILELFGHRRLAGYVEDVEMFGGRMCRIDVYVGEEEAPSATQFYGGGAIYCTTPTTAEIARAFSRANRPRPVAVYELPAGLPPRHDPRDEAVDALEDDLDERDRDGVPF